MDLSPKNLVIPTIHPPFHRPRSGGYIGTQGLTGGPSAEKILYYIYSIKCRYCVIKTLEMPAAPCLVDPIMRCVVYRLLPSYWVVASASCARERLVRWLITVGGHCSGVTCTPCRS
jgi:hypothetical protein